MVFTKDTELRNVLVSKVWNYFPAQMIWMVLVGIVVWIILNRHRFGAHVYLIGDNEGKRPPDGRQRRTHAHDVICAGGPRGGLCRSDSEHR